MRSLLLSFLLIGLCFDSQAQAPRIVITNVSVVDVNGERLLPDRTVVISNGRIVRVDLSKQAKVARGGTVIDGQGKFLIPGLWDTHVHLSYSGVASFRTLLTTGVTSVRDMGGDMKQLRKWRTQLDSGKIAGPNIYYAGPFIDSQKPTDVRRQLFTMVVETEQQGRAVVDTLRKWDVDFIRINSRVSKDVLAAMTDEAKKKNVLVTTYEEDVDPAQRKDIHSELESSVKGGLTPMKALKAVTIDAARSVGADKKVGAIQEGMRADVVLLNANPLTDIKNTKKIEKVIAKGKVIN